MNNKLLIALGIAAIVIAVFCHIFADHTMEELRSRRGPIRNGEVESVGATKTVGTAIGIVGAALLVAGLVRRKSV